MRRAVPAFRLLSEALFLIVLNRTGRIGSLTTPRFDSVPAVASSSGNVTIDAVEAAVASLENVPRVCAIACASGMSAVTQAMMSVLSQGDRVIVHRSVYFWADSFFVEELPQKFGIQYTTCTTDRHRACMRAPPHVRVRQDVWCGVLQVRDGRPPAAHRPRA